MSTPEDHGLLDRVMRIVESPRTAWLVILGGAVLRLWRYAQDRGMMHDEAWVTGDIITRSLPELFKPLRDQVAPVGFLLLQKLVTTLFGSGEYAVRLVPLLAGIAALPIFHRFVKDQFGVRSALLATTFMALAEPLVYYSAEGKQYSTDVLCSVLFLACAARTRGMAHALWLALIGAILIWFSHPIVFVLAGVGGTLILVRWFQGSRAVALATVGAAVVWMGSLAANYLLVTRYYSQGGDLNTYVQNWWKDAFAPLPVSLGAAKWYPATLSSWFRYPVGLQPQLKAVGLFFFVVGCCKIARQQRLGVLTYLLPLLAAVAASALRKYPVTERLMLWATPLLITPAAVAVTSLWNPRTLSLAGLQVLVAGALLLYPVYLQAKYTLHPPVQYDAKPGLRYIRAHWHEGDMLYLHYGANALTDFYLVHRPGVGPAIQPGDNGRIQHGAYPDQARKHESYSADIAPLKGRKRVWVVFAMGKEDAPIVEAALDAQGRRIEQIPTNGGAVDLYDLSSHPAP